MTDGKQPAFPEIHIHHWRAQDKEVGETDNVIPRWMGGLTKREYFAAKALQGLCAYGGALANENGSAAAYSRLAIECADALIEELNK